MSVPAAFLSTAIVRAPAGSIVAVPLTLLAGLIAWPLAQGEAAGAALQALHGADGETPTTADAPARLRAVQGA